jgi:hypothetical protein
MNKDNIPSCLHHLISLVEKWGIGDDGYRDELVSESSREDLEELVKSLADLRDDDVIVFEKWLCDPVLVKKSTIEYINYSCYFMAYEYAKLILKYGK